MNDKTENENEQERIYVALDLGSESMAAYYQDSFGTGGMIDMQGLAPTFLGLAGPKAAEEIVYLEEDLPNGERRNSPRLWNRISFNDGVQPCEPGDAHAQLRFLDSGTNRYNESLFRYFHGVGVWPPTEKVMPNPKILFQHQIRDILPAVSAAGGGQVKLTPELLVQHLTLQVVTNFVLDSMELRDADRRRIYLTVTVPNVYSLPHALSLKNFISKCAEVADVDILSESDAVACSVLSGPDEADPPDLRSLKEEMQKRMTQSKRLCLVTIDIGKGTTDLSCILIEEPKRNQPLHNFLARFLRRRPTQEQSGDSQEKLKFSVLGKTGKSSGGNYLSFIIARHYDRRLKMIADEISAAIGEKYQIPFGFIAKPETAGLDTQQLRAISALEKLIDQLKRSITEEYKIDQSILSSEQQRELLDPVVDEMLKAINPVWERPTETVEEQDFRRRVIGAMLLPQDLGGAGWRVIFDWFRSGAMRVRPLVARLGRKREDSIRQTMRRSPFLKQQLGPIIQEYTQQNVDDLLDSLKSLVGEHQVVSHHDDGIDKNVFVIVSGQASQFKPIRRAILEKCDALHISREHIYLMNGVAAKEACCRGVITFKSLHMLPANPTELHGTYGCLAVGLRPKEDQFKAFDMRKIKNGGSTEISFGAAVDYYIVFTPRSYHEVLGLPPKKNDRATALITRLVGKKKFQIAYDPKDLHLSVNGEKLELRGFGDVDGSIYPKVWPEIVAPKE